MAEENNSKLIKTPYNPLDPVVVIDPTYNSKVILKRWQKPSGQESTASYDALKDDAIKIVHDTIHDFFVDSETFNDKDKLLLKINKAICNNIMGY